MKALAGIVREWREGPYSRLDNGLEPLLDIEEVCEIRLWELWDAPNRGYTFYSPDT